MGVRMSCDGCDRDLDPAHATEHGRVAKVVLCPDCAKAADDLDAAIEAERVRVVTAFEAWVDERKREARKTLKRLPDD